MFLRMFIMGKIKLFKVMFTKFYMWTLEGCFGLSPMASGGLSTKMCLIILKILSNTKHSYMSGQHCYGRCRDERRAQCSFSQFKFFVSIVESLLSTFVIILTKSTLPFLMLSLFSRIHELTKNNLCIWMCCKQFFSPTLNY